LICLRHSDAKFRDLANL